jgi:hypothetical protein
MAKCLACLSERDCPFGVLNDWRSRGEFVGVYRSEVVTGSLLILVDARVDDSDDIKLSNIFLTIILMDDMMMDYLHSLFYSDVVFCQGTIDCATGTTVSNVSPSTSRKR